MTTTQQEHETNECELSRQLSIQKRVQFLDKPEVQSGKTPTLNSPIVSTPVTVDSKVDKIFKETSNASEIN
ncbi:Mobilization protein MbeC [Acrasis kona]|uniref:Mobilization protein MbeC n=1 Tax=Acrasis kona TaxID=1008807 RepID=A0AAW2Z8N1_9EUKA